MVTVVKFIALFMSMMGVAFLVKPEIIKELMTFLKEGKRLYLIGVLRLILGVVLIWAAGTCRISAIVAIIGALPLMGGILIFSLGLDKVKVILDWWLNKSIATLRLISVIPIILGALLLYAA